MLAGGSNTLVHLRPAPVVARVMTATGLLHDDVEAVLANEVSVGAYLGERGLAVAPSDLLDPGPHEQDGLWMTFWRFVEHDASRAVPPAEELGHALRALHDALSGYGGELPPVSDIRDWLAQLTDDPERRARLDALTPTVFAGPLPAQPIHGDASMSNVLRTTDGLLWNDLEDVCTGPVHWDLGGLVLEARERGAGEDYITDLLRAYGGVTLEELGDFIATHALYGEIWRTFSRSP